MTNQIDEAVYLLSNMIEIPSPSREEGDVATFLEKYIRKYNLPTERIMNNIIIRDKRPDRSKPTILLNSHIDTVKPVKSWIRNPFKAELNNGCLYGLGSNDAGASVVTLLLTAIKLFDSQKYNLVFCASAEEEISGKSGIEAILNKIGKIDLAIVGEPTNMQPAVAEKGLMVLDCECRGKSGHAARNEGINAITKAMPDLTWFQNYRFKNISEHLGEVKMSVTQIEAGTQHNVVPDLCKFVVDIRGNGCYSNDEILSIIREQIESTITPRSTRLNSSMLPSSHPIYKRLIEQKYQPYGSPTLSDQALMPFHSFKMGPGLSARSHTADEFIKITELEDALIRYEQLLDGFTF